MATDTDDGTYVRRSPRRFWKLAVPLVAMVMVLSSCFVLKQGETFAIGTETNRLNLVVYIGLTKSLDDYRINEGTTAARDLVLRETPPSISLSPTQISLVCFLSAALCAAGFLMPGIILSWWKSDIRNRSDFKNDVRAARQQSDCFAWTALPSRNFTTKPPGNSGCR